MTIMACGHNGRGSVVMKGKTEINLIGIKKKKTY